MNYVEILLNILKFYIYPILEYQIFQNELNYVEILLEKQDNKIHMIFLALFQIHEKSS
ncbi:hypothetical protein C1646_732079 [Rhizophagus diaphanus]|nr:hypothetical protein C1646_732079 [Rhizophagus diaphanus] [Rhizophagus sp. MUCL 43196]